METNLQNLYVINSICQNAFAAGAGIMCLTLVLIQGKGIIRNNSLYRAIVCFVVGITALSLMYSLMLLFEAVTFRPSGVVQLRCVDFILYGMTLFFWIHMLQSFCNEAEYRGTPILINITKIFSIIMTCSFIPFAVFHMDEYYDISDSRPENIYYLLEFAYAVIAAVLMIACISRSVPRLATSTTRGFIVITGAALIVYYFAQLWELYSIDYKENYYVWEVSGWIILVINLAVCWFIYRRDFQPMFETSQDIAQMETVSESDLLDMVAQQHKLTKRERQITELMYRNYTNKEIADELFVSINTVKTHVRNIYEKLNVYSRVELKDLINKHRG